MVKSDTVYYKNNFRDKDSHGLIIKVEEGRIGNTTILNYVCTALQSIQAKIFKIIRPQNYDIYSEGRTF